MRFNKREMQILNAINNNGSGWILQEALWVAGFKRDEVRAFARKINREDIMNYPSALIKEMVNGKAVYYEDVEDCLPNASTL